LGSVRRVPRVREYGAAEEGDDERRTRRTGRFDYRLTLPGEVNNEGCTAELENGVLRLRLPKAASGIRQRIPVQSRQTPETGTESRPTDEGETAATETS
jgi:HSP20 family protein